MPGRALLIGASEYGEGIGFFGNLPAAKRDVEVMEHALKVRNFEVEVVSEYVAGNSSNLFDAIQKFCESIAGDIGIVYFSGHGVSLEGQDCLVPAGVSRGNARIPTKLVNTDFSECVIREDALVIMIIDACRVPPESTSKGGEDSSKGWSLSTVKGDKRFIRLFGCGEGEQCHVWRGGDNGNDISIFTAALTEALKPENKAKTLADVLKSTDILCNKYASQANPALPKQTPVIRCGDTTDDTLHQLLELQVFPLGLAENALFPELGEAFVPGRLQCLVIDSEHASRGFTPNDPLLSVRVDDALLTFGGTIWEAFCRYWGGLHLVDGSQRLFADAYSTDLLKVSKISVHRAFENSSTLEQVIRWVVQADIVFVDLTRFEPGALFLLGLRAATRRGLTICTHAQGWREGQQLDMPFNLSDLQVFSHSDAGAEIGEDPVVSRIVKAVEGGFLQMSRQPRYQDLPAYDSLRELGPDLDSWQTIPSEHLVLSLCSFRPENRERWKYLERRIKKALSKRGVVSPQVRRLIDLGSSQLVSQSLYEHIRRVAGCVMDWSLFSPSTFMELGVRLAVSPWGVVQLIEESFCPGGSCATCAFHHDDTKGSELQQVMLMKALLGPRVYRQGDDDDDFADVADNLLSRRPFDERTSAYGWIHSVVQEAIEPVSQSIPPVYQSLCDRAQSLRSDATQRDRREITQALFYASTALKKDREAAALETRIAAWLYLEHRLMGRDEISDDVKALRLQLGEEVAAALYEKGDANDFAFAEAIMHRIQDQP